MGKGAGTAAYILALVCGVFWLIVIVLPSGWQAKDCAGLMTIYSGLFQLDFEPSLLLHSLSMLLGKYGRAFKKIKGTASIKEMQDQVCNIDGIWTRTIGQNDSCEVWSFLLYGSWIMAILGFCAALFFFIAAGFGYQYWTDEAREAPRKWARVFYVVAPCTSMMGMILYTALSWNFSNWLNHFPSGGASLGYSHVFMLAWFFSIISWIPCIINESFARYSWAEAGNEERAMFRKEQREDALMDASYGSTAASGGYAQQPPMGDGGYAPAPMGFVGQEQMGGGGYAPAPIGHDTGAGFTMPQVGPQYN